MIIEMRNSLLKLRTTLALVLLILMQQQERMKREGQSKVFSNDIYHRGGSGDATY